MTVIRLDDHRTKIDTKEQEVIVKQLEQLIETIKDGRLEQIALQFDQIIKDQEDQETHMLFWNRTKDFDQIVGFTQRFLFRLTNMADRMDSSDDE